MLKIISILLLVFSLRLTYQLDRSRNLHVLNISPSINENSENILKNSAGTTGSNYLTHKKQQKPCSRRNSQSNPIDNPDEWLPTYSSRVVKPSNNINSHNNNVYPELLKNENSIFKTEENQDDPSLVQKQQRIEGGFLNPRSNFKPSRNLLLSDEDELKKNDDPLEYSDESQYKKVTEKSMLEETAPDQEKYHKSNVLELENKKNEPGDTKTLLKPLFEKNQQDRDVLVDEEYLSKPKAEIETEPKQSLLRKPKPVNLNNVKDQQTFKPDDYIPEDNDRDNCLPNEQDLTENTLRRSFSEIDDIEGNENYLKNNKIDEIERNNDNELQDPAKGVGIRELSLSRMSLLQHSRVCYACSTVNNPTCWEPNRRTTVKYCRQGHQACVTKTFQNSQDKLIVTRDCGESCDDTDIPGPRYKSCSVCHTDMCNDTPNGAVSIKKENFIVSILVIFVIKCVL